MSKKLSFEAFVEYYKTKKYLPLKISCSRKNSLNEKQLRTKYKEYEKKLVQEHKKYIPKYQEKWVVCRENVYRRDNKECQLWKILTVEEKETARKSGYYSRGLSAKITPAHVVARSRDSKLICKEDNVYTLSLMFHNRMDSGRNPITDDFIGKQAVLDQWWRRILPRDIFEKYKEKY